jgi:tetratricopeptide (TPR) repeat protein
VDSAGFLVANSIEACVQLAQWDKGRELIAEAADLADMAYVMLPASCLFESYAGDLDAAKEYLAQTERTTISSSSIADVAAVAACRATIALVEGDFSAVFKEVDSARDAEINPVIAPYALVAHAAIWAHNLDEARAERVRMEESTIRNDWHVARVETLNAGIVALEGDAEKAVELYREVLKKWDDLEIPLGRALSQMDFALAAGGTEADDASREAEAFFTESGNQHFVRRLQAARVA